MERAIDPPGRPPCGPAAAPVGLGPSERSCGRPTREPLPCDPIALTVTHSHRYHQGTPAGRTTGRKLPAAGYERQAHRQRRQAYPGPGAQHPRLRAVGERCPGPPRQAGDLSAGRIHRRVRAETATLLALGWGGRATRCEYLCRVLSHRAALTEPRDLV